MSNATDTPLKKGNSCGKLVKKVDNNAAAMPSKNLVQYMMLNGFMLLQSQCVLWLV